MKLGGFRDSLDKSLGVIIKLLLIGAISLAIFYLAVSIYANVTENKTPVAAAPPDISKAHYVVTVRNTLEKIYTDNYTLRLSPHDPNCGELTLYNYWEVRDGEYKLFKHQLVLDEFYYGRIIIERRQRPATPQ